MFRKHSSEQKEKRDYDYEEIDLYMGSCICAADAVKDWASSGPSPVRGTKELEDDEVIVGNWQ